MNWKLTTINQETDHRFLNFFTFIYTVNKDGEDALYPYYVASRRSKDKLSAKTGDFQRADGVLILVIKEEPEPSVLLIEQFRPPLNSMVVEIPAGLLEPEDENEIVAACRESIEEAGVELTDVRVLCPASPTSAGLSDELAAVVEGKVKKMTATHLERFEDISARFVPLREIPALLEDSTKVVALNLRLCLLYLLERYKEVIQ